MKNSDPFNEDMLKRFHQVKLQRELAKIPGPRCLYAETQVIQYLNFCFEFKFADIFPEKVYALEIDHEAIDISHTPNVIFFLYPQTEMMNVIASMVLKNQTSLVRKSYWLFFMPNASYLCTQKLEQLSILHKVNVIDFHVGLVPLTQNLFSLQLYSGLDPLDEKNCVLESMLRMSNIMGKIKNCFGLGEKSSTILKQLHRTYDEFPDIEENQNVNRYLIAIDRSVDYVTPMLTGFSYECLLDFFFGISFNQIKIPGYLMDSKEEFDTFLLYNKKDKHYGKLSCMAIQDLPEYLKFEMDKLNKEIKEEKEKAKSLEDINKLNDTLVVEYVLLQIHEKIVNFLLDKIREAPFVNSAAIETKLIQQPDRPQKMEYLSVFYPFEEVFRLQILSSHVSEFGSYYNRFDKKINSLVLDCYHPKHLVTVKNLLNDGVLRNSKNPLKWKEICERYDLIPDNPHSYTHLFIAYSCLLVRFVELFLTENLNPDMSLLLSGNQFKIGSFKKVRSGDMIYIYLVGGVSWGELQGFRLLGNKLGIKFVVCTTGLTRGSQIVRRYFT